jgi:hypothetical protein
MLRVEVQVQGLGSDEVSNFLLLPLRCIEQDDILWLGLPQSQLKGHSV